jgi:DNA-binding LacI/PurR family transcriptional regulator
VPRRLSVIGFDDVELARYCGLTTVAQPLEESGALGAEALLTTVAGGTPRSVELRLELQARTTTAPSPGKSSTHVEESRHTRTRLLNGMMRESQAI